MWLIYDSKYNDFNLVDNVDIYDTVCNDFNLVGSKTFICDLDRVQNDLFCDDWH